MQINTLFSIQEHYQISKRSSHFDLRILDLDKKVLWSWAFPKRKFPEVGEKALAIKTVDHKMSYMYFQGKLNNGDVVTVYDKGKCKVIANKHNFIIFYFNGNKIKGAYNFIKLFSSKDSWLVTKSKKYNEPKTVTQSSKRKQSA